MEKVSDGTSTSEFHKKVVVVVVVFLEIEEEGAVVRLSQRSCWGV